MSQPEHWGRLDPEADTASTGWDGVPKQDLEDSEPGIPRGCPHGLVGYCEKCAGTASDQHMS
jgi:hypothetical protein